MMDKILKIILIAAVVIVIGWFLFNFFVGLGSMNQWNAERCIKHTNSELERLKTEIESGEFESLQVFSVEYVCWDKSQQNILLKEETDPAKCAEYCGATMPACVLLDYENSEYPFTTKVCVDIPVEFVDNITINAK